MMQSQLRCGSRPSRRYALIVALAAGLALAGCAASQPASQPSPASSSRDLLGLDGAAAPSGLGQRELTPAEKKLLANAIAPSLRDAGTAQYHWSKIENAPDGQVNYCGMVNAKSPYPAYNGRQAYILTATLTGGKVSSAVVDLIAGGKDVEIVRGKCKQYGVDLDAG
jgi:hypothetical protein